MSSELIIMGAVQLIVPSNELLSVRYVHFGNCVCENVSWTSRAWLLRSMCETWQVCLHLLCTVKKGLSTSFCPVHVMTSKIVNFSAGICLHVTGSKLDGHALACRLRKVPALRPVNATSTECSYMYHSNERETECSSCESLCCTSEWETFQPKEAAILASFVKNGLKFLPVCMDHILYYTEGFRVYYSTCMWLLV